MQKAAPNDARGRIREIQADPCNQWIPRAAEAGKVVEGLHVMHNGLRVHPMGRFYLDALAQNRGCHEPQEEYLFQEALKFIPAGGTMLELGAYWAFYSLWFAARVPDARCYMVEPDPTNLEVGKRNFEANGRQGRFFCDKVGRDHLKVDQFLDEQRIEQLDLLHADVQCAELEMLEGAEASLSGRRIGYVFLSTHGQDLHYRCLEVLRSHGYVIVAHADWYDGTYCQDGVIVARAPHLVGLQPLALPLRAPHRPYAIGSSDETWETQMAQLAAYRGPLRNAVRWVKQFVGDALKRSRD
ncbi:MAG: FkbM family methyltransferase [Pirellulales bacterium]